MQQNQEMSTICRKVLISTPKYSSVTSKKVRDSSVSPKKVFQRSVISKRAVLYQATHEIVLLEKTFCTVNIWLNNQSRYICGMWVVKIAMRGHMSGYDPDKEKLINCIPACYRCNAAKRDRHLSQNTSE